MFPEQKYGNDLQSFECISLEQMDQVKFMNRIDTKFLLGSKLLPHILSELKEDYYILAINNEKDFPYKSLYFDTRQDEMYTAHHNQRVNRYKIRFREYIQSNITFLEIKLKNQKKRTIKNRIEIKETNNGFCNVSKEFINQYTPFNADHLEPKLYTNFRRITLVSKKLNERITVDYALNFTFGKKSVNMDNVAIIETKCDQMQNGSKMHALLNDIGIKPSGMSKYCIGRLFLEKGLKHNNFKERLLTIKKIINDTFYYRLCS